jgi:hypothetical protein
MKQGASSVLVAALLFLACCGQPTTAPGPNPSPLPTPAPTPAATPTPTPADPNDPPTVRITGDAGCHPVNDGHGAVTPCTVIFEAVARDTDGDSLSYEWSGCASGTEPRAACRIDRLDTFTAEVRVSDGRGGVARSAASARGTNRPPVEIGPFGCVDWTLLVAVRGGRNTASGDTQGPFPTNAPISCMWGNFPPDNRDPEGDLLHCDTPVPVRGPCGAGSVGECGGAGDAMSFDFHTGAEPGQCVFTATIRDGWGAAASATVTVLVAPP